MTRLKEAIRNAPYAVHRALILNELVSLSRQYPHPVYLYHDDKLNPKNLKAASKCTVMPFTTQNLDKHTTGNAQPLLLSAETWSQIDAQTADKIARVPYVLYVKDPAGQPAIPTKYLSKRLFYAIASNFKDTALSIHPYIIIFLLAVLLTALSTSGNFIPPDDYARHAKAYQYQYNYTALYPHSIHPSYDSYILFDVLAGTAHTLFGSNSAVLFQIVPFLLTMLAVHRLASPAKANTISLIIIATTYFTWTRFQSARPCILESSIFLFVYAYKDNIPVIIHYITGLVLAGLYHIFFVYTIPLWLPKKTRIPYIAATLTGIAFWATYSSGHYFGDLLSLVRTKSQLKVLGVEYSELQPILGPAIFSNFAALAPLALYYKKDLQKTAIALFFLFLNQVRYLETAIPITLSFMSKTNIRINAIALMAALAIFFRALTPTNYQPIHITPHSSILTYSSTLMNSTVSGSDYITISPTPNLPWDNPDIQQHIVNTVKKGSFDCSILNKYHFDYIIENHFKAIPQCLVLQSETPGARIWTPNPSTGYHTDTQEK